MALLGDAAMVIQCDFDGDAADHDDWHTHEHLRERLSLPGFLRGTRWVARTGAPRYLIVYEVSGVDVATSEAYLARLNAPSQWTAAIMGRVRAMVRGFTTVAGSAGYGLGTSALCVRFQPGEADAPRLRDRMVEMLPSLAARRGMASAHLLQPVARPPMTREQSLRGRDADLGWVLLATAYDAEALARAPSVAEMGIDAPLHQGIYEMRHTVTDADVARSTPHSPRENP